MGSWARRLSALALMLLLLSAVAHRFEWLGTPTFRVTLGVVAALALAGLVAAGVAFRRFWERGDRPFSDVGWAVVFSCLALAPFAPLAYRAMVFPALNDVSTDLADPPEMPAAAEERTAQMNAIAADSPEKVLQQRELYPKLAGRRYDAPVEKVEDIVRTLVDGRGWSVSGVRERVGAVTDITIEALAYTDWLAFPVDVAIRVREEEGATFVDMRSASRYGGRDFGDNAERIDVFLSELDALVPTRALPVQAEETTP